jgi:phosphoribosylanthranilate isomerase
MPGLWIKICGVSATADIEAAAAAGANALGFVFYEPSPRHLSIDAARRLQAAVPAGIERVAVFLHPSQAEVDAVLAAVQPDWLQTDLQDLARLSLPATLRILPVLRGLGSVSSRGRDLPSPRVLVEGGTSGQGQRADWAGACGLAERCEVVLAGGLDAANVAAAVRNVAPFGVDVSSGVESTRGVKDPARIRAFVHAARDAHGKAGQEVAR